MEKEADPYRLLTPSEATAFLGLAERSLEWREKSGELAMPVCFISPRKRRYRYGDLVLVASGARPLVKTPEERAWESPYSVPLGGGK